jgi:hypothetical protein
MRSKSGAVRRKSQYSASGQVWDVALEVPLGALPLGRRGQRDDAAVARVERVDDPLDCPALAGGVSALEDDDELVTAVANPIEHVHELDPQPRQGLLELATLHRL